MALTPLSELTDYRVVNKDQDVRGWPVRDAAGNEVGKVDELIIDTDRERVSLLRLDTGQQIVVENVALGEHVVTLVEAGGGDSGAAALAASEGLRFEAVEERLHVGKRDVDEGGVRVSTVVTERPVEERVRLREEQVEVGRRPADRPLSPQEAGALQDRTLEVRERAEVPVVAKEARVVEEVVVRRDVALRPETVRDTVRRADIQVEEVRSDGLGDRSK